MRVQPLGAVTAPPAFRLSEATITSPAARPAGLGTVKVEPSAACEEVARSVTPIGGVLNVKQPAQVPLCASVLVTTTLTAPAVCEAVLPVIAVALTVATVSGEPPNETVAPA